MLPAVEAVENHMRVLNPGDRRKNLRPLIACVSPAQHHELSHKRFGLGFPLRVDPPPDNSRHTRRIKRSHSQKD
jgi:hypothetical protein